MVGDVAGDVVEPDLADRIFLVADDGDGAFAGEQFDEGFLQAGAGVEVVGAGDVRADRVGVLGVGFDEVEEVDEADDFCVAAAVDNAAAVGALAQHGFEVGDGGGVGDAREFGEWGHELADGLVAHGDAVFHHAVLVHAHGSFVDALGEEHADALGGEMQDGFFAGFGVGLADESFEEGAERVGDGREEDHEEAKRVGALEHQRACVFAEQNLGGDFGEDE